jgi:hypothetical protein
MIGGETFKIRRILLVIFLGNISLEALLPNFLESVTGSRCTKRLSLTFLFELVMSLLEPLLYNGHVSASKQLSCHLES